MMSEVVGSCAGLRHFFQVRIDLFRDPPQLAAAAFKLSPVICISSGEPRLAGFPFIFLSLFLSFFADLIDRLSARQIRNVYHLGIDDL